MHGNTENLKKKVQLNLYGGLILYLKNRITGHIMTIQIEQTFERTELDTGCEVFPNRGNSENTEVRKLDRTILHSDCNCFYASVEMLHHPELEGLPLAVGGDPEARHGIVLTANYTAKRRGVKTGMALWQARQACPELVFVPPRMDLYMRFSKMAREIYGEYTDKQEPFGIDECWLDCTASTEIFGPGPEIAYKIRQRIRHELGITVSIGVSWNKIYAKLGSDYKKPDAITVFDRSNYRKLIWPLPAQDLLCVGRSTGQKLLKLGIPTIGAIAETDPEVLHTHLGKMGLVIHTFANGWDDSPVQAEDYQIPVKSIGNGTTTPRDLVNEEDVRIIFMALCESVSARLRDNGFLCRVVEIGIRDNGLYHFSRQATLSRPTDITDEIMEAAMGLFRQNYTWEHPIRSLTVRGTELVENGYPRQMDLFVDEKYREKKEKMDRAVDAIRRRYGYFSVQRAMMHQDEKLADLDAKGHHTTHPIGYFHG